MQKILALLLCFIVAPAQAAIFWDYDGKKTGQDSWGELSKDFAACGTGSNQSPIAIGSTKSKNLPNLEFHYEPTKTNLALDRYTVVATPDKRLVLTDREEDYALTEMLIRSPSEHEVTGVFYPFELQLIHQGRNKQIVIVSIFVTMDEYNANLQPLIDNYPTKLNEIHEITLNWNALLPASRSYFSYRGSLSYPPCTENVNWRVFKNPISLSQEQAKALAAKIGRNARASQPLMLRTILESEE